ncbi:MAG: MotA/TolQ/ExbB proton channel family protein [Planctomycetota bacterium]|jgi:biopolymer transport protein ExbB
MGSWTKASATLAIVLALAATARAREGGLVLDPDEAAREAPAVGATSEDTTDVAGGSGLIVGEDEGAWQLFWKGGIVMPAILIASIVALAFATERGVALRGSIQTPPGLPDELFTRMTRGGMGAAASLVEGRDGVLSRVLAAALGRVSDGRAGMEEAAAAESYRALYDLRRNVRPVGIVASVAPLMGLLGTVLGMIQAFDSVSGGGLGRGEDLARGIAKALLTTGAGLMVAIPALLVYQYLRWRSEDLSRRAEAEAAAFIDRAAKTGPPKSARPAKPGTPQASDRPGKQVGKREPRDGADG